MAYYKFKLSQIVNPQWQDAFRALCQVKVTNFKDNYSLAKSFKKVEAALKAFDATRAALLKTYGTDIGNNQFKVEPSNVEGFNIEIGRTMEEEVEIYLDHPIELPDGHGLSPLQIVHVFDLVEEP